MTAENELEQTPKMSLPLLAGGALGVVFGDIGTSPLYTLKTVLYLSGDAPSAPVILGLLSLIFWTLVIVTSLKYAMFAMRIDNRGEGGIMALMSLLVSKNNAVDLRGETVAGCGHFITEECHEAFIALVVPFLSEAQTHAA